MIKKVLISIFAISIFLHAGFESVSKEDKQHRVEMLELVAKKRVYVNRWTKATKNLYRQHKHFGYTLEAVSGLFLLEEPNKKP